VQTYTLTPVTSQLPVSSSNHPPPGTSQALVTTYISCYQSGSSHHLYLLLPVRPQSPSTPCYQSASSNHPPPGQWKRKCSEVSTWL